MITYFLNWMGPVRTDWFTKRGLEVGSYSVGRIDVDNVPGLFHGREYSVPPLHSEDWADFGAWLSSLETEHVWTYDELIKTFEEEYGKKLRWLE